MFNLIYSILFYNFYMKKEITCTVSIADEGMSEEEKKLRVAQFFVLIAKWKAKEKLEKEFDDQ